MKFLTFFDFILVLIYLTSGELTIRNVQIKFKHRRDKTDFQLISKTKSKFSRDVKVSNAWLGIGFNSRQKMVDINKYLKHLKGAQCKT